jgi:transcriptional regulator with XRE-family HTH domain
MRFKRDLSQPALAERAGIDIRTLQRIERRELPEPRLRPFVRLARALNCKVDELIEPDLWNEPLEGSKD